MRISYRFYRFVTTRYTIDFYIIKSVPFYQPGKCISLAQFGRTEKEYLWSTWKMINNTGKVSPQNFNNVQLLLPILRKISVSRIQKSRNIFADEQLVKTSHLLIVFLRHFQLIAASYNILSFLFSEQQHLSSAFNIFPLMLKRIYSCKPISFPSDNTRSQCLL